MQRYDGDDLTDEGDSMQSSDESATDDDDDGDAPPHHRYNPSERTMRGTALNLDMEFWCRVLHATLGLLTPNGEAWICVAVVRRRLTLALLRGIPPNRRTAVELTCMGCIDDGSSDFDTVRVSGDPETLWRELPVYGINLRAPSSPSVEEGFFGYLRAGLRKTRGAFYGVQGGWVGVARLNQQAVWYRITANVPTAVSPDGAVRCRLWRYDPKEYRLHFLETFEFQYIAGGEAQAARRVCWYLLHEKDLGGTYPTIYNSVG